MLTSRLNHHLLYLAWKLNSAEAGSVATAKARLVGGEGQHLYQLRAWAIANGQVSALLVPEAPLEQIAQAIWAEGTRPLLTRWVASRHACLAVTREIEASRAEEMSRSAMAASKEY
jgi:hypothetical protein